ncbi:MAG: RluA family pseudouridine synthase [Pseudomonadota bacterium]|nr:RluA family pseudouridine synthase [Pseudomonadota bacterium]
MSEVVRQFTVAPDDEGVRLDRWFKRHLPDIGFATISRWARTGQIRLDGKRADPADRVLTGQVVRVPPGGDAPAIKGQRVRKPLTPEQREMALDMVIRTTPSAFVLNKPPGLATQGGSGTFEHVDGLLDALAQESDPRPRLVHRLDKDTSGVLLIARTPGSAAAFSKHFSGRSARKIYWALVIGVPAIEDGLIELPLGKQPGSGGEKMMVDESEHGQSARTRYRVIDHAGNRAAWVELQPLTGRTHQLRVHMAAIGHPIVGDGKYGGPDAFLSGTISRKMHLHARRLVIPAPGGDTIDVTADLPDHFAASMVSLGFDEADGASQISAPAAPSKEAKKAEAKAHAKQYRKERRGERRSRSDAPAGERRSRSDAPARPAKSRGPTKGKGSPKPVKPAKR